MAIGMTTKHSDVISRKKDSGTLRSLINDLEKYDSKVALLSFTKTSSFTITYQLLASEIKNLSASLTKQGIKRGDNILFFAPNSHAWIISALATIYSGATIVPIDSQQANDVLVHIINDSVPSWIFTDERGEKRLHEILPESQILQRIVLLDKTTGPKSWRTTDTNNSQDTLSGNIQSQLNAITSPRADIAVLFYTSGTTGIPKGVPLSHNNLMLQLNSITRMGLLKPQDRVLLPLPLFHVYPLNIGLLAPLMMGLPIILPHSLTGPQIMRAIREAHASVMLGVPRLLSSLYQTIAERFHHNKVVGTIFEATLAYCEWMDIHLGLQPGKGLFVVLREKFSPSMRLFACGGAPLDAELARKLRALGWDVAIGYGLTETSPLLTVRMPDNKDLESVGTPIDGVEIKITQLPQEEQENKMPNKTGEILARGANVFSGYRNLLELNKEIFTTDGWFKTGDLGSFEGGNLHVIGRASSTIVMDSGEKIQPEYIEDKITQQPGIAEIGLLQVEHKLVALIVPDLNKIGTKDVWKTLATAIKETSIDLPSYQQITGFAITSEPLPRTNLGKIKRHELKASYEKAQILQRNNSTRVPDIMKSATVSSFDRTLMEDAEAASCFKWLQKRFPETETQSELSLDTNLKLDLNIDSLEWINLTLELDEQTGLNLSAETISQLTTIRDLLIEVTSPTQKGEEFSSPIEEPEQFLNDEQREFLKPLTPWQSTISQALYKINKILMLPYRVTASNSEPLPCEQIVFVPNHASYIDAFALAAALPPSLLRNTQWAAWTGIAFSNAIFSLVSRLARVIPIEAKHSLIASLALAASVLKSGDNLIWFPEGERTLNGKLLPFKKGLGLLLAKSKVLVVPVYLDGTRQVLPPGAFFPRVHKITVIFGAAVSVRQLLEEGTGTLAHEKIVNALRCRVEALSQQ